MTTPLPLLSAHGLVFSHADTPLFTDLSLDIGPGVTLLQGDDGAGKTTLLRLLAGALTPQRGTLHCQGRPRAEHGATWAQQVHWADPHSPAHDATVVAAYFAAQSAQHPRHDAALLAELLPALGLSDHLHKPLHMLSTGSKRKVWLAAAFASGAPVTLLDDPCTALDARSVGVVRALLQDAADHLHRAWVVAAHAPLPGVPATVWPLPPRQT